MYQHTITAGTDPASMAATPYDHLMDPASTFTLGHGIVLGGALALVTGAVLLAGHGPRGRKGLADRSRRRTAEQTHERQRWPAVAP